MCKKCDKIWCRGCEKPAKPEPTPEELARIREQGRKAVEDGADYMNAWEKVGNKSPFNSNFGR